MAGPSRRILRIPGVEFPLPVRRGGRPALCHRPSHASSGPSSFVRGADIARSRLLPSLGHRLHVPSRSEVTELRLERHSLGVHKASAEVKRRLRATDSSLLPVSLVLPATC